MSDRAEQEIREIYTEVDRLVAEQDRDCQARTTCCHFLITGKTPMLTAGEALVAAKAVRASGRKTLQPNKDPDSGRCPLLGNDNRCIIYPSRPIGCRTHFCNLAGGPLPRRILQTLIHRLEAISESLGDTDPRPLELAITRALETSQNRR